MPAYREMVDPASAGALALSGTELRVVPPDPERPAYAQAALGRSQPFGPTISFAGERG